MPIKLRYLKGRFFSFSAFILLATLLLALVLTVHPSALEFGASGIALADDDGGDDDDDSGGGSSAGSGSSSRSDDGISAGGSYKKPKARAKPKARVKPKARSKPKSQRSESRKAEKPAPKTQRRAPAQITLAANAPREIVALGLSGIDLTSLQSQGYQIVQRDVVRALELVMVRLAIPQNQTLAKARSDIEALGAETDADLNHFYRNQQGMEQAPAIETQCEGEHCAQIQQISWPLKGNAPGPCADETVIGMIDTGINAQHEAFAGQNITVLQTAMPGEQKSGLQHGTAVAAILIGAQNSRTPGILTGANLLAVDVFHRDGSDERADVYAIVKALDTLDQRGAKLINMSLAGPPNIVLARMVSQLNQNSAVIVAAAGNEGPNAPPAFPAAYPEVVAVTAIDASAKIYRRANQGTQIDFAAPGVNIWTAASVKGAKRNTGTSFAAPFVTATLAAAKTAAPLATPTELVSQLQNTAIDLGKKGFDPVFGNGLVQTAGFCNVANPPN